MDYFFDYTSQITNQFIDPKKRVFLFYILISILIATAWFMINKKLSLKKTLIKIFDKKIFFSKSAKSDYKIFLINQLIMMIVSPFLITQLTIATALYFYFHTIDLRISDKKDSSKFIKIKMNKGEKSNPPAAGIYFLIGAKDL